MRMHEAVALANSRESFGQTMKRVNEQTLFRKGYKGSAT